MNDSVFVSLEVDVVAKLSIQLNLEITQSLFVVGTTPLHFGHLRLQRTLGGCQSFQSVGVRQMHEHFTDLVAARSFVKAN